VDYEEWNPATDRYVPHRFDPSDLSGKARNKEALLDLLRMPAATTTASDRHGHAAHHQERHRTAFDGCRKSSNRVASLRCARQRRAHYEPLMHGLQERFPGEPVFYQRLQRGACALHEAGPPTCS